MYLDNLNIMHAAQIAHLKQVTFHLPIPPFTKLNILSGLMFSSLVITVVHLKLKDVSLTQD